MKYTLFATSLTALGLAAGAAQAQTVLTTSNGIIRNSLCVGSDCQSGISFSDSTIILKENNTRLKFADTSTGSFPNRDWELEANSQSNGGANHFALLDCGASSNDGGCSSPTNVFTVVAGARSNALYVDSQGDIGIGTSTPATDIDIKVGDSPTVRLQQDGTSGFTPQTWDVAGNESSFFIRDATGGSTLPFRIMGGGAPSESLVIDDEGNVGIGAGTSPDAALHVQRSTGAAAGLLTLENNGGSFITLQNTASGNDWFFTHENNVAGRFIINNSTNPAEGLFLDPDGDMTIGGTLTTGGGTCGGGCDAVFSDEYALPSIAQHSQAMYDLGYLPNVGPTPENAPINVSDKLGRMLNELEHAHIYIAELETRLSALEASLAK